MSHPKSLTDIRISGFVQRADGSWEKPKHDKTNRLPSSAKPEQVPVSGIHGPVSRTEGYSQRFLVSIVSYRRRLIDMDNLVGKPFCDCIRRAGLIPDDAFNIMDYRISQQKAKTKAEERTEITIEPL